MRPRVRALLLVLVLAPAVALCLLGQRSLSTEGHAARLEALASARRIRADLVADLERGIRDIQEQIEAGGRAEPGFVVRPTGRIVHPPTRSFPAKARSFPSGDLVAIRGFMERTDRALFVDRDPRAAIDLLQPALGIFEDEDLAAILRDRAALAFQMAGEDMDAIRMCRRTFEEHPAARDLDGFPLAIPAARRWSEILRAAGKHAAADRVEEDLARALAENPWALPEEHRALILREIPRAPAEEALYATIRNLVVPEVGKEGGAPGRWTTLRGRAAGHPVVVTYRQNADGEIEGAPLAGWRLREILDHGARSIGTVTGATILLEDGSVPEGAETIAGPLAPPFSDLSVTVAVVPDPAGRLLPLLWAGLSVLLIAGLATGVLLGLRAVRREMRLAWMRQEFLDNVSHELRTPLASIRALAENLRDRTVPGDRTQEYFDALQRESRRVARLVEDVLDLSRLDRGAARFRRETFDPGNLAREAVRELAAEPGAEDFEVRVNAEDDLPATRGDPEALGRALLNLLVNAARYSPAERSADLEVAARNGRVRFSVRDRGRGIPRPDRRAVFDRFHRVSSETHEVKGAGLGLPLALAVVEAHGGTIRLESEVGRGSTFTIEVPVT